MLTLGFVRTKLVDSQGMLTSAWQRWFTKDLLPAVNDTTPLTIPGPFPDDATAKSNGVAVGSAYHQASGAVVVRLT